MGLYLLDQFLRQSISLELPHIRCDDLSLFLAESLPTVCIINDFSPFLPLVQIDSLPDDLQVLGIIPRKNGLLKVLQ